jgi:hypothetical protein
VDVKVELFRCSQTFLPQKWVGENKISILGWGCLAFQFNAIGGLNAYETCGFASIE